MTATVTHLRPASPPDLITQRQRHLALADQPDTDVEASWNLGVGVGITLGCAVVRGGEQAERALEGIASYRQDSQAGAADARGVDEALRSYFGTDLRRRVQVARSCGVMRGFKLATAEREDAGECPNCGDRLLVVMPSFSCPSLTHGRFCDDDVCAREFGCSRQVPRGRRAPVTAVDQAVRLLREAARLTNDEGHPTPFSTASRHESEDVCDIAAQAVDEVLARPEYRDDGYYRRWTARDVEVLDDAMRLLEERAATTTQGAAL